MILLFLRVLRYLSSVVFYYDKYTCSRATNVYFRGRAGSGTSYPREMAFYTNHLLLVRKVLYGLNCLFFSFHFSLKSTERWERLVTLFLNLNLNVYSNRSRYVFQVLRANFVDVLTNTNAAISGEFLNFYKHTVCGGMFRNPKVLKLVIQRGDKRYHVIRTRFSYRSPDENK